MKKVMLLLALPLSLSLFSFTKASTVGVTMVGPNEFDVAAQNSISAVDRQNITNAVSQVYGIQLNPTQDTYLDQQAMLGIKHRAIVGRIKIMSEIEEFLVVEDEVTAQANPQIFQVSQILGTYLQN